jgi:hypothetical protein
MLRILVAGATVALLSAAPAFAQFNLGPSPGEENSMHTGTTATNGSSTIVTDRNGTHPEGYPGFAVVNRASAGGEAAAHHRHHHHRPANEPAGR